MCAGHTVGNRELVEQINESPGKVKKGMEVITESVLIFVKACIRLGVDGFYASTQGAESNRFADLAPFNECIKPYDLAVMNEINDSCIFNILHICDYHGGYRDLTPFLDYPGHVVNCSLKVGAEKRTAADISRMFGRPYMGGMDRHGTIVSGSADQIQSAVEEVLREAPDRFILGADCTLPSDIDWDNIRTAISTAHAYSRGP
jgi:uroporphyrinogen decarboxylase